MTCVPKERIGRGYCHDSLMKNLLGYKILPKWKLHHDWLIQKSPDIECEKIKICPKML